MLLTLDLSSQVGWTLGLPANRNFLFDTYVLPKTGADLGRFAKEFDLFLRGMIQENQVQTCCFESPILPVETQLIILRKLYGLAWHVEYICKELQVECFEANLTSVKKFVTGNGRAKKQEMLDAIQRYGYEAKTFDEADAIGVRLYTLAQRFPELGAEFKLDLGLLGQHAV